MRANAVEQLLTQIGPLLALGYRGCGVEGQAQCVADLPVANRLPQPSGLRYDKGRAGRQEACPLVQGEGLGNRAPQKKAHRTCRICPRVDTFSSDKRADLRGEADGVAVVRVIQGFDPMRIACEEKLPLPGIPQGESEHPAQTANHGRAVLAVQVQEDLGIRVRAKEHAFALQLFTQDEVIVDFAVEGDDLCAVHSVHRLCAGLGKVDDGQSSVCEPQAAVVRNPASAAVGPARGHRVTHADELVAIDRSRRLPVGEDAVKPAHRSVPHSRLRAPLPGKRDRNVDRVPDSCPRPIRSKP